MFPNVFCHLIPTRQELCQCNKGFTSHTACFMTLQANNDESGKSQEVPNCYKEV